MNSGEGNEASWQALLEHTQAFLSGSDANTSSHALVWDTSHTQEDTCLLWTRLLQVNYPSNQQWQQQTAHLVTMLFLGAQTAFGSDSPLCCNNSENLYIGCFCSLHCIQTVRCLSSLLGAHVLSFLVHMCVYLIFCVFRKWVLWG